MKILTVLGARPQFIKAAPLSHAIRAQGGIEDIILHTGQHYDSNMSDVFFDELGIEAPRYHLNIGGGTHGAMTGRQLVEIEAVLLENRPDVLLVYGDTNSTVAGALAAAKLDIPVAHVEAGLRSFNRKMPEEINRVLTDHISTWLFPPSEAAVAHLRTEGIDHDRVMNVGDIMYDAARLFGEKAARTSDICNRLGLEEKAFRLATVHRQENTDDPARLRVILETLATLAEEMPLVLPLHPRTRARCANSPELMSLLSKLTLTEPLGFFDIIRLQQAAMTLVTDSGGMQKEAFFHKTPVVVLRTETEWTELVDLNWARLIPPFETQDVLNSIMEFERVETRLVGEPYGNAHAAEKILNAVCR
ncbi:non-hydrolyzing UDP-N-acetylglucosamine 2-epimerase [Cochlodiniinecator piscidefendens]|uniref:non-hydrolyzing UDP-N-acetylglucosamine 2-epimerase n=1 Tax=Cochlodiniinecator piscidefendens TaxID=2715756 RepID=UPI0014488153|nr:UDP-N-acetylglucosamine 2-epimerase (non-hydrolyzing) [Cochlodiniinecator piscidefendens]